MEPIRKARRLLKATNSLDKENEGPFPLSQPNALLSGEDPDDPNYV